MGDAAVPTWDPTPEDVEALKYAHTYGVAWRDDDDDMSYILRTAVESGVLVPRVRVQELLDALRVIDAGELAWLAGYLERDGVALRKLGSVRSRLRAVVGDLTENTEI